MLIHVAHSRHFLVQGIFLFAKLKPDLCFKIRLNSIIYFLCFFPPILFIKLDNYSKLEACWPVTKLTELISGQTYRVVESCEMSDDLRGCATVHVFHRFIWRADHTGLICLPAIPNSLHTLLPFSLCRLFTTHTIKHTHTHGKTGGSENEPSQAVGGPCASVHIKTPLCRWRRPAIRGACRSSNFNGHIISNDNKAQESFRWKCRTSRVFHTRWMRLPWCPHSVSLSAWVTDQCQNDGTEFLLSVQRWRGWEGFSFLSFNHYDSLFSSFANTQWLTGQHDLTVWKCRCWGNLVQPF